MRNMFSYRGVEYILPAIFKAYPLKHAEDFLKGIVYFTNLCVFRKDEDEQRGDPLEGIGVSVQKDVACTTRFQQSPIFVWCSTMETQKETILETWRERDTVIEVFNLLEFINRIITAGRKHESASGSLHIGPVTYDKDTGSHRATQIIDGLFQKNLKYQHQKEFRFAIYGIHELSSKNELILELGDVSDIARFV
jgi:hypothetical protein